MKNIKTRDLIYCALFAALTAIGAFLHFQLFQATITLQFYFTAMAGLLLGAKLGALSQLLYVVLGLVGVPIFAAGGGFGYIFNPTFGFLLGLIPTAWVIGKIAEKDRSVPRLLLACFAGLAVVLAMFYVAVWMLPDESRSMMLQVVTMFGLGPVLIGNAVAWPIYLKIKRTNPALNHRKTLRQEILETVERSGGSVEKRPGQAPAAPAQRPRSAEEEAMLLFENDGEDGV